MGGTYALFLNRAPTLRGATTKLTTFNRLHSHLLYVDTLPEPELYDHGGQALIGS